MPSIETRRESVESMSSSFGSKPTPSAAWRQRGLSLLGVRREGAPRAAGRDAEQQQAHPELGRGAKLVVPELAAGPLDHRVHVMREHATGEDRRIDPADEFAGVLAVGED